MENYANIFPIDGIENDYRAERDVTAATPKIVVRDYHGLVAFVLDGNPGAEEINRAVSVYEQGFRGGERYADAGARAKVLKALGIDATKPAPWAIGEPALTTAQPTSATRAEREPNPLRLFDAVLEITLLTLLVFCLCAFFIPSACDWFGTAQTPVEYAVLAGIAAGVALPYFLKCYVKH